jgi:hypothetical protein
VSDEPGLRPRSRLRNATVLQVMRFWRRVKLAKPQRGERVDKASYRGAEKRYRKSQGPGLAPPFCSAGGRTVPTAALQVPGALGTPRRYPRARHSARGVASQAPPYQCVARWHAGGSSDASLTGLGSCGTQAACHGGARWHEVCHCPRQGERGKQPIGARESRTPFRRRGTSWSDAADLRGRTVLQTVRASWTVCKTVLQNPPPPQCPRPRSRRLAVTASSGAPIGFALAAMIPRGRREIGRWVPPGATQGFKGFTRCHQGVRKA